MGVVIDSCKSTIKCCDSDDETGYKERNYSRYIPSDSEESKEEDDDLNTEKEEPKQETKITNIKDVKIDLFMQRHQSPWQLYEELEQLGSGFYGVVKKVRLIKNPEIIRAMKIIPEENILQGEGASLIDEIEILKSLEHPNIMKVYESFVYDKNYYIVSELCDQGHLLSKLEKLGKMDQIVVKFLMDQIFNAVAYLHSKNIMHGDLKLENVLLYTTTKRGGRRFTNINQDFNSDDSLTNDINKNFVGRKISQKSQKIIKDMMKYEIKLIDFGCSKYFVKKNKKKKLTGIIGTSIYCSPEVVDNLYDETCDEWSCGVLMYILLCGEAPFMGETEEEIFDKIKKCQYSFSNPAFRKVSKNCKDLIRRLLEPKKQYRIKAREALRHPFFTESFDPNSAMTEDKDLSYLKRFTNPMRCASKFHEAIIAFLCVNYIPKDEENNLKTLFRYMDKEEKNAITKESMKQCLEEININISDENLDEIFNIVDENATGFIEYHEFIRNACDINLLLSEANLKNVFLSISGDKDFITGEDIKKFIFHDAVVNEKALKEYFDSFGMKYESNIKFDDFYDMIKKNKKLNLKKKKSSKGKKRPSKYEFKGPVIDEDQKEDEQSDDNKENNDGINGDEDENDGDNEEEKENEDEKENKSNGNNEENHKDNNKKINEIKENIINEDIKANGISDKI